MTGEVGNLRIDKELANEGRFHRQELIEWWDQERLRTSRVLLIGAGALGNEILKNLALVGVGNVLVVDMDLIEHSNLARSVLFREEDIGRPKAEVATRRALEVFPEMHVGALVADMVYEVGTGIFRWADVVLCGLDNREARVAANRACQLVGRPWIDGAIERLDGVARVFLPGTGACYECTMNDADWQALEARRSCALLNRDQMEEGRTPTTATSSSIIAGFQCQELLKILHAQPVDGGTGVVVNGQWNEVYKVSYPRKADCIAHEVLEEIVDLSEGVGDVSVGQLIERAVADLGPGTSLELSREILSGLDCPVCGTSETIFRSLGVVNEADARCRSCGEIRIPLLMHSVDQTWEQPDRSFAELGLPAFDLIVARNGFSALGYLFTGDRSAALAGLDGIDDGVEGENDG